MRSHALLRVLRLSVFGRARFGKLANAATLLRTSFGLSLLLCSCILFASAAEAATHSDATLHCHHTAGGMGLDYDVLYNARLADHVIWGSTGLALTAQGAQLLRQQGAGSAVQGRLCAFEAEFGNDFAADSQWSYAKAAQLDERLQIVGMDVESLSDNGGVWPCEELLASTAPEDVWAYCARERKGAEAEAEAPALPASSSTSSLFDAPPARRSSLLSALSTLSGRSALLAAAASYCSAVGGRVEVGVVAAHSAHRVLLNHAVRLASPAPHVVALCAFGADLEVNRARLEGGGTRPSLGSASPGATQTVRRAELLTVYLGPSAFPHAPLVRALARSVQSYVYAYGPPPRSAAWDQPPWCHFSAPQRALVDALAWMCAPLGLVALWQWCCGARAAKAADVEVGLRAVQRPSHLHLHLPPRPSGLRSSLLRPCVCLARGAGWLWLAWGCSCVCVIVSCLSAVTCNAYRDPYTGMHYLEPGSIC